jgi:hypothetical protein
LKAKFVATFCAVALMLALVAWMGYRGVANGLTEIRDLSDNRIPAANDLAKIADGQSRLRDLVRQLVVLVHGE